MIGFICFVSTVIWFMLQRNAYRHELPTVIQSVTEAVSYVLETVAILTFVIVFSHTK